MSSTMSLLLLAWIAIVLLSLALGGLTAQIHRLRAAIIAQEVPIRGATIGRIERSDGKIVKAPYIAIFTQHACRSCEAVVSLILSESMLLSRLAPPKPDIPLLIISDAQLADEREEGRMSAIDWIVNAAVSDHFNIPAFPWLIAVDGMGNTLDDGVVSDPHDAITRINAIFDSHPNYAKGASA